MGGMLLARKELGDRFPQLIDCPSCFGKRYINGKSCPTCDGTGGVQIDEIDHQMHSEIMKAYSHYTKGHLVDPGGIYDQSAFLVDCIDWINNKVGHEEFDQMQDLKEKQRKAEAQQGRRPPRPQVQRR